MTEKREKEKEKNMEHERINDILLGPLERPALAWLVKIMPPWMTPDILTLIGTFAALLIMVSYWLTNIHIGFLWLASFGFILNWFGDSLDGNLARYRNIQRPKYGFFVDHIADTLNEMMIFLGIGLSPFVDFRIACLALIGYLMMSILVYVKTYVTGVFQLSYAKLGPTEIRALAILVNIIVFFGGNPMIKIGQTSYSFFNIILSGVAVLLVVFYVVSGLKTAYSFPPELPKKEKKPRKRPANGMNSEIKKI